MEQPAGDFVAPTLFLWSIWRENRCQSIFRCELPRNLNPATCKAWVLPVSSCTGQRILVSSCPYQMLFSAGLEIRTRDPVAIRDLSETFSWYENSARSVELPTLIFRRAISGIQYRLLIFVCVWQRDSSRLYYVSVAVTGSNFGKRGFSELATVTKPILRSEDGDLVSSTTKTMNE